MPGLSASREQPPKKLSIEEYERNWKPKGWELLPSGMREHYRREGWGMWEAIRDIVQNALDESESYSFGYDAEGLWISDTGGGVSIRDFMLGGQKEKPEWARGRYGEGMKLSVLTLLRENYMVYISTVGREIWPVFHPWKTGPSQYDDMLVFLWRPIRTSRRGTTFHIIGYDGPSYDRYFAVNLPKSLILARVPSPITEPKQRLNSLIRAEGMAASKLGGIIYCRDIYLMEIESPFSYNLWGFKVSPDRHGPEKEDEMWADMARLWCGVSNPALLKTLIKMLLEEDKKNALSTTEGRKIGFSYPLGYEPVLNKSYLNVAKDNADAWKKAWRDATGTGTVLRTNSRYDAMVQHLGYKSVKVHWLAENFLSALIMSDRGLIAESQERLSRSEAVPDNKLTVNAQKHLMLARRIAREFRCERVSGGVIPQASDMARTAGMYDPTLEEIIIHINQMETCGDMMDTLVHELGHHVAYLKSGRSGDISTYGDLTEGHSAAMSKVSADIITMTQARTLDEYFKGCEW